MFINFMDLSKNQPLILLFFSIVFLFMISLISAPVCCVFFSACFGLKLLFCHFLKRQLGRLTLDLSAFLIYAFNVTNFPVSTAFATWYSFGKFYFYFHSVQNVFYFFLRLLPCPKCYLNLCCSISRYLGMFQFSVIDL